MSKTNEPAFVTLAVMKSLETSIEQAAGLFGMDADELREHQHKFLLDQLEAYYPKPVAIDVPPPSRWDEFRESITYEIGFKVCITLGLMMAFWLMPYVLERFLDPLSNTIVWAGFTALYYLSFGSLGIELVFLAMHRVNFQFFNRFTERGQYDYESFLRSSDLTSYEKCVLNQQKYLAYLALFCLLVFALLNQLNPSAVVN